MDDKKKQSHKLTDEMFNELWERKKCSIYYTEPVIKLESPFAEILRLLKPYNPLAELRAGFRERKRT